MLRNLVRQNIIFKYLKIFSSRFAKYYQLKYLQILSSNILFKICKILSAQISPNTILKYSVQDLQNIISSNISPANLSQLNLIRRMKISKFQHKGIPQSSVFHQTEVYSHLRPIFWWVIFNLVISRILPFLLSVKRKFGKHLVSPTGSSAISFHLSVEAKTFQNFRVQQTIKTDGQETQLVSNWIVPDLVLQKTISPNI